MQLAKLRASGGYYAHWVDINSNRALCDFIPSAKRHYERKMKQRHGWKANVELAVRDCAICTAKKEKLKS